MRKNFTARRPPAFTLIEILVVVAIIGLLLGLILPSLGKAREQTKRAVCAANLRQIGMAVMAYLQDSRDRMPYVSFMPSIDPAPLSTPEPIFFADVLARHLKGQMNVLACPQDRPGATARPAPNTGRSYFDSERSSYEYRVRLGGLTPPEFHQAVGPPWRPNEDSNLAPNTVWVARDYANFHGKAGEIGARRYLYFDGHVADYEN